MTKPPEEFFVQLLWPCECGARLQVHGEHYVGFRVGQYSVTCPKCGKEHDLPTKALRVFTLEGDAWQAAGQ